MNATAHLLELGLTRLRRAGVTTGDIRWTETRSENLLNRNGVLEPAVRGWSRGFGVRCLLNGAWGFAASDRETEASMEATVDRALAIAAASARAGGDPVSLVPVEPLRGSYRTPLGEDPFEVPLGEKVSLLVGAVDAMRAVTGIVSAEASLDAYRFRKRFVSTDGADLEQEVVECGAGIVATAKVGDEVQRRSYPNSFRGNFRAGGYEFVRDIDLLAHATETATTAVELCHAPDCPDRTTTVVIDADQMGLQVHESCGHPTELDRVLGTEISLAGGSFMGIDGLGSLRYGSDLVTIHADSTTPGGLGTFGWDDEGVPAHRAPLIEKGTHVGYLTSRETAGRIGATASGGTMRADGWSHLPLIRMVNVNLQAGEGTLEEILSDVKDGIYIRTNKAWSIDDLRLNFQFGCELAWEIKNGKRTRLLKNPIYTGSTPEFWGACTAVGGEEDWLLTGLPSCGKGEPMQVMHVSHGAPPARFENVRVGVSK